MAWAGNAEPRSTTKYPTTPATTATIVATVQVFIMNPANMPPPCSPPWPGPCSRRDLAVIGGAGHQRGRSPAPGCWPGSGQPGGQIGGEDNGDDEEADRQALMGRSPVVA